MKKTKIWLCAFLLTAASAHAQEASALRDPRLSIELQLKADAFRMTNFTFAETSIRGKDKQDYTLFQWPLNNIDYYKDDSSYVDLSYNGAFYGGNVRLTNSTIANGVFGLLKGWVQFGPVKISVGNVIGSTYADSLGAEHQLRIYTGKAGLTTDWTAYKKPDNITGDEGVLVEAFVNKFTFAVAGGNFLSTLDWVGPLNNTNDYALREGVEIRYGGRAGYDLGALGKVNASYMIEGKKINDAYGFKRDSSDVAPKMANAESYDHLFGLFGSFHLTETTDLTVGYVGALTAYLTEFYSQSQNEMVETGYPFVFRNGLNVNARFKFPAFTLLTDNCLTFWQDQNYSLLETGNIQGWSDMGLEPKSKSEAYTVIDHLVLWNKVSASYPIRNNLALTSSLRNFFSYYNAEGNGPTGKGVYSLVRDQVDFSIGASLAYNANIEAWVSLGVGYMMTSRTRDLNSQSPGYFIANVNNNPALGPPAPVETVDHQVTLRIPIGIKVKY